MKIYLAGKIPKGKEVDSFDNWQTKYREILNQIFPAEYVDHSQIKADESDYKGIFGLDCNFVKNCDLVIVNAEKKLGVGTAQEMVIAKYFKKPVITILPKETHHRKKNINFHGKIISDWIHPFIYSFSDLIFEDIQEFKDKKETIENLKVKDLSIIDESIDYFNSL
jgi:nucleoside 2-deoxyribosyltransferase